MNGHDRTGRVLGLGLGVALIAAMAPGVASAQDGPRGTFRVCDELDAYDRDRFDDTRGSEHELNILCMADHGLTEGLRGGDSYGPRLDVNRGQMASFIARFIEDETGDELEDGDGFRDVVDGYVHAESISKLANIGVTSGTARSDGLEYAPLDVVSRAQMASFISRALTYLEDGRGQPETVPTRAISDYFSDDDGSVHEDNINALRNVEIVWGFPDRTDLGVYGPDRAVTRDQMASYVMRGSDYAFENHLGFDFGVIMTWEEEVIPGQPNAEGFVRLGIDEDDNSIEVKANYARVTGPFAGAPGLQIHEGARGTDGPIVVQLATGAELEEGDGSWWATVSVPTAGPDAFGVSDLLDDPEAFYLNLYSDAFPAGAIRGQLPHG
jgi:hypothetical protein